MKNFGKVRYNFAPADSNSDHLGQKMQGAARRPTGNMYATLAEFKRQRRGTHKRTGRLVTVSNIFERLRETYPQNSSKNRREKHNENHCESKEDARRISLERDTETNCHPRLY